MDNISGKTVVITGAARGIGQATAKALLARGARVVIGDRDVDVLEKAVADMSGLGAVSGHPLDVTDRESFAAFLD
ncbi:MAG: SDR family NAD(P)-dependent oxidoreductase, partial [Mycobacterium sp.]